MEEKIKNIMEKYIKDVEDTCNILLEGINYRDNLNLKTKKDFFDYRMKKSNMEFEVRGISYRLHGKGCMAFNKEFFLDWDFGYRSRWCGIDPWKLSMTIKKSKSQYSEYYDGNLIKKTCEQAVKDGIMFKKYEQYYFAIPKSETFKPQFPKEFDTLVVTHRDSTWSLPRNKVIDKFIRKSSWVYNKIDRYNDKYNDKYVLSFLLEEKEIYSISYDDIGYPEGAIKIMSDDILHNLLKAL